MQVPCPAERTAEHSRPVEVVLKLSDCGPWNQQKPELQGPDALADWPIELVHSAWLPVLSEPVPPSWEHCSAAKGSGLVTEFRPQDEHQPRASVDFDLRGGSACHSETRFACRSELSERRLDDSAWLQADPELPVVLEPEQHWTRLKEELAAARRILVGLAEPLRHRRLSCSGR